VQHVFVGDCMYSSGKSGGEKLDVCAKSQKLSCHDDWLQLNDTKPSQYSSSFQLVA